MLHAIPMAPITTKKRGFRVPMLSYILTRNAPSIILVPDNGHERIKPIKIDANKNIRRWGSKRG